LALAEIKGRKKNMIKKFLGNTTLIIYFFKYIPKLMIFGNVSGTATFYVFP
jgi:hypothetical protein